jgi:SAM-dependent methyltransferase
MECTICGNVGVLAFIKNDYRILKCANCDHYYTELKVSLEEAYEIYSDKYFFGGEVGYPDYKCEKDILIQRGEYYANKISKKIKPGKVLDIGAAAGFILRGFENMGWQGIGIEPNASMVEFGRQVIKVDLRHGTLETIELDSKFDLVIMIQVIAHLFDLNSSIKNVINLLKPGGYVLIETWNRSSMTAKLFGRHWHEYSPPSTLNFFNKETLDNLLNRFNFHKIQSGWPQKKIMSNHAKSLLKHKMVNSMRLNFFSQIVGLIPDNIILPYPAEDLFWVLYQKDLELI